MLESASNYTQVSKKLLKIANLLEYNVKLANEPAIVNIKSDDKTDIKLKKVGIIGTIGNSIDVKEKSSLTTPDPISIAKTLKKMREKKIRYFRPKI